MIKKTTSIPVRRRSKYYEALSPNSGGGAPSVNNTTSSVLLPFTYDENGNLVFTDKAMFFNAEKIDADKIITWNDAVALKHQHDNKALIDTIDQNLSKASEVQFAGIQNYGVLNMHDNNIWACGNVDFTPYPVPGADEVRWNSIINDFERGFILNNHTVIQGNVGLYGASRDIYSHDQDMNIIRYSSNWQRRSFLTLNDKGLVTNNLSVEGTFNCYELIANKIRATNGMLYVTDSGILKTIGPTQGVGIRIEIEEPTLRPGDIILIQKFTGKSVVTIYGQLGFVDDTFVSFILLPLAGQAIDFSKLEVGDSLIRIDSTDVARRNGILLNPYGTGGGYIDFYKGNSVGTNKAVNTSLGQLNHLNKAGISGYGLYSENVFLTGNIRAKNLKIDHKIEGSQIDTDSLEAKKIVAQDSTGGKLLSINEDGAGSIQRFVNNKLRFEIASNGDEVKLIYYNENGSIQWQLGSSGTIATQTVDMWREIYLYPITSLSQIETVVKLPGQLFKEFHSGSVSGNQNYNGLTAIGSISSSTPPSAISDANRIKDGQYTLYGLPALAFKEAEKETLPEQVGYTRYQRLIYVYAAGKLTNQYYHEYYVKDLIEY